MAHRTMASWASGNPFVVAGGAADRIHSRGADGGAVLDRGGGDHHGEHQAAGVDGDVPLAAAVLLGVIPAPAGIGTVSAARTGRESITAVVGRGSRPAAARGWSRHPLCSSCKVPSSRQRAK